jgi:hypothetical protein
MPEKKEMILMGKEHVQADCGNMIGTDTDNENIIEYRCKYYAISPPPCHMKVDCPYWVDLFECKHRILVSMEEFTAQLNKENKE